MISLEKDLPLIVFSDLDGTLLDHETYSWAAAEPALAALRAQGIPLVLASSKTALEIAPLRAAMGFSHCPAIVENGAGLLAAGADPQARSGQSTAGATHLIKVACETALGKRPSMQVFGTDYPTPDGTCVRDYIHVTDLVVAHRLALGRGLVFLRHYRTCGLERRGLPSRHPDLRRLEPGAVGGRTGVDHRHDAGAAEFCGRVEAEVREARA